MRHRSLVVIALLLLPPGGASAATVARIGGVAIDAEELERAAAMRLFRVRSERWSAERAALDAAIEEKLLAARASADGTDPSTWLEQQLAGRYAEPAAAEVAQAYEGATGSFKDLPRDEGMADLARAMREVRRSDARKEVLRELRAAARIDVDFAPPRLALDRGGLTVHGTADAPVTIDVFEDFQCPFCAQLAPRLAEVREKYPVQVRIVHRDLPLAKHPDAKRAAEAAACADEQGRYWELAALLYANQKALDAASIAGYAKEAELDTGRFASCIASARQANVWKETVAAARRYAIGGTPALFINGRLVLDRSSEGIESAIQDELRAASPRRASLPVP